MKPNTGNKKLPSSIDKKKRNKLITDFPKYLSWKLLILIILYNLAGCKPTNNKTSELQQAIKTKDKIKVDGKLNEPIWQKALFSDKFYNAKNQSNNDTKSLLAYDEENLYVAFQCQVKDTSLLTKLQLDKDDQTILGHEWVAFCIDTYNDGVAAYTFITDANGNQLDGAFNPNLDLTYSFSSNWTSAVQRENNGYTVEMKIPLDKLPTKWNADSVEMSVLMLRSDKQNNQMVESPVFSRGINQFQKVTLRKIRPTHPKYLSGVDITDRLNYKKSKIDRTTLIGRSKGGDASIMDYYIFKKRAISGADKPRELPKKMESESIKNTFENTEYLKNLKTNDDFETLLERSQTTAFLVLHEDTILCQNYFNGFNSDSIFTSFSVAKSFVSALVGLAISDGYIKSDTDKITAYLPELLQKDSRFSEIKIRDLLSMSSGLAYSEDGFPSDDEFTYIDPDLRKSTLQHVRIAEPPRTQWLYNNYNPLLLGMILERITNRTVSKYMEEKLWKKMGGDDASWSLDENGFEKMESGINCHVYDYARFALLFMNHGRYNNTQVIPKEWVQKATQPQQTPKNYYDSLLDNNVYYSYSWWGKFRGEQSNTHDFFGMGNKGEYVYVCPQKKLIIIRLGFEYGLSTPASLSWPGLFYEFASNFKPSSIDT